MSVAESITEEEPVSAGGEEGRTILSSRFEVFPDQPLPEIDSPGTPAFHCVDLRGWPRPLFALLCHSKHCPRIDTIPILMRMPSIPIIAPIFAGTTYWPPANAYRAVLIFERPAGRRLVNQHGEKFKPWREDRVIDGLIRPLLPALKDFERNHISHRAIRATNLFFVDNSERELILGECVSSQPAYNQEVFYEPIASAMSLPGGRGNGSAADDLYALGAMIIYLLTGGDPVSDMSEDQLIRSKLSFGSYATLARHLRVSLPMVEVLRGLLCDDGEERWNVHDLSLWLNGRHLSPMQPILPRKAAREYEFRGERYSNAPALAHALAKDWDAALEDVSDGTLLRWVQRSLGDPECTDRVLQALDHWELGSNEGLEQHYRLGRILIALDPNGPIRFRRFRGLINGLHKLLATGFHDEAIQEDYRALVLGGLPSFWFTLRREVHPELATHRRAIEVARQMLSRGPPEFGLARALYTTNLGWPCQSEMLGGNYVSNPDEIIVALEETLGSKPQTQELLDEHLVAFAAANYHGLPELLVMDIIREEKAGTDILFTLELLSEIQRTFGPPEAPRLTRRVAAMIGPVIETYHNRETRHALTAAVQELTPFGNLARIFHTIDDRKVRQADDDGFALAQRRYYQLARYRHWLEMGGHARRAFVQGVSRPISTIVSALLACLAVLVMTMNYAV